MLIIVIIFFRDLFGILEFNLSFNFNVFILILIYVGMIFYLNYYVLKFEVSKKNI